MMVTARITAWVGGWARASNDRALENARAACTVLSRRRVERDEVALYLSARSAEADRTRAG